MLHVRGFVATLLLVAAFCPNPAGADGAVAVGLPADVAKDGVSIKGKVNFETPDTANAAALKGCQTPPGTSTTRRQENFARSSLVFMINASLMLSIHKMGRRVSAGPWQMISVAPKNRLSKIARIPRARDAVPPAR